MSLRIKQPGVVLLGIFFSCLLYSCEKKDCNPPSAINITTNSPIVEGWNLNLETVSIGGGRYVWSGPNGWKEDNQTIGSDDNMESISNLTPSEAGDYSVKVYNHEGCLVAEGKTTVEVIAPPNPPCTVAPNTNQMSAAGVLGSSFTYQNFASVSGTFDVTGSSFGAFMQFGFWGQTRPKPGVYEITGGYIGSGYGTTGLFIQSGPQQFFAQGGKAYVTLNNGKLSVSICSILFSNPITPTMPITASANITEP
jgi:hypothetical protein